MRHILPAEPLGSVRPVSSSESSVQDPAIEAIASAATEPETETVTEPQSDSMAEYYALQRQLLQVTLICTVVIFGAVWWAYSLNTAASYLLGAMGGLLYLRMLGKAVERIGERRRQFGKSRLALFVVLIVLAARWQYLELMPVFLGFLTYKAALIWYTLRTVLPTAENS